MTPFDIFLCPAQPLQTVSFLLQRELTGMGANGVWVLSRLAS